TTACASWLRVCGRERTAPTAHRARSISEVLSGEFHLQSDGLRRDVPNLGGSALRVGAPVGTRSGVAGSTGYGAAAVPRNRPTAHEDRIHDHPPLSHRAGSGRCTRPVHDPRRPVERPTASDRQGLPRVVSNGGG